MPLLVNQVGRLVVVDDPKQYDYWLTKPGFRKATPKEEKEYLSEVRERIKKAQMEQQKGSGIYLATVSVGGKDGYGRSADLLVREFKKLGIKINRYYDNQKIALILHAPPSLARVEAPYRILYTMFESTKLPDAFTPFLKEADKVIVPSKWCKKIFDKTGINAEVVPLGYDQDVFKYKPRENKRKLKQKFTFFHYNAFNVRKGFLELFKAFTQEFEKDEPVRLLLKTTLNQNPASMPINKSKYPNIDIVYGKIGEADLLKLHYESDCFVFPSRGEGFGLPPIEAMATGMPAIVPNAHGISEYFNDKYMYEVKVKENCPGIYLRYRGQDVGEMVVCDIKDLRKKMRWVYEHQDEAIKMGKKASKYVKKWTIKNTAEHLNAIYEEILEKPIKDRPIKDILTLEVVE